MLNKFVTWTLTYRWWVICAALVLTALTALGMRQLEFNPDSRVFFSEQNPQLIAFENLEATFNRNENIYIGVRPKSGDLFNRRGLQLLEQLTEACWQIPFSSRVDSITNFQHMRVDGDDLEVNALVTDADRLSPGEIEEIRNIVLNEEALVHHLINPSGEMAGVNTNIIKTSNNIDEVPRIVAFARELIDDFATRYPDYEFFLTGSVAFDQSFAEVSQDDSMTLVPLMYLIIIIGVGILLRSWSASLITFVIIGLSTITAMGCMGYLGWKLTTPTAVAPIIIMTLAVADSVHILTTLFSEMREGKTREKALREALRINIKPVFITSLTTAIGFLSLNASDVPPFRELGNIVAVGVFAAFVYSVILLPALIAVLPVRVATRSTNRIGWSEGFAGYVIRNHRVLLSAMLFLILLITLGISRIELNDNFIEYLDASYPVRSATDLIVAEQVTGLDIIEYMIDAGRPGGISDPVYLRNLDRLGHWFEQHPDVMTVSTFADTMKRLNRDMNGNDPAMYKVPESSQLAAQYLLLYEMSLPYGLDLNNRIDIDKSKTRLTVILERTSARKLRELDASARQFMSRHLPDYMYSYGTSLSVVFAHISERNIDTMLTGITFALVLISTILIIALGSIRYGVLSLIPNLFPAMLAFGVWGYLDGQVGLAVAVVAAISLGIVVDDTVHFLSKYLRARQEQGLPAAQAITYSFTTVGTAIVVTSVALSAGFLVLSWSGFYVNYSMGVLTVIAIAFALITDFLLLPPLLLRLDKHNPRSRNG